MTKPSGKVERIKPMYVVMLDGEGGPRTSLDTGNPWNTLKGARYAINRQGKPKSQIYYIVKFVPERRIAR